MTDRTEVEEIQAEARRNLDPDTKVRDAWSAQHARLDAADAAEASTFGVTVEELRAARRFKLDPVEYHRLRSATTAVDVQAIEADEKGGRMRAAATINGVPYPG